MPKFFWLKRKEGSVIYLRFAIAPAVGAIQLLQNKALQLPIDEATCALDLPNTLVGHGTFRPNEANVDLYLLREVAHGFW